MTIVVASEAKGEETAHVPPSRGFGVTSVPYSNRL
jgi:hypothetical protein